MPSPLIIAVPFFVIVMAGAVGGWSLRKRLPKDHLTEEPRSVVSVAMAVVATISALVLALLISNANTAFSALRGEVTTLSAEIIRLDNVLRRYGADGLGFGDGDRKTHRAQSAVAPQNHSRPGQRLAAPRRIGGHDE